MKKKIYIPILFIATALIIVAIIFIITTTNNMRPTPGEWTGENIIFNVSKDGNKIIPVYGKLVRGKLVRKYSLFLITDDSSWREESFFYADYEINDDGTFSASKDNNIVKGKFSSENYASGTVHLYSNETLKSFDWEAWPSDFRTSEFESYCNRVEMETASNPQLVFIPIADFKIQRREILTDRSLALNTFSKDFLPIKEYKWGKGMPEKLEKVYINYYIKNIGGTGESNIYVTLNERKSELNEQKSEKFKFEPQKNYVIRVVIQFIDAQPVSWYKQNLYGYSVNLNIGEIEKIIPFTATRSSSTFLEIQKEEMLSEEVDVDPNNFPDNDWFVNTVWVRKYNRCIEPLMYVKLHSDGTFGWNRYNSNTFKTDDNDTWTIKGGNLVMSWNKGYAIYKYKLSSKEADYFVGTSSRDNIPRMIERISVD